MNTRYFILAALVAGCAAFAVSFWVFGRSLTDAVVIAAAIVIGGTVAEFVRSVWTKKRT